MGLCQITSKLEYKYFITFVDDYSCCMALFNKESLSVFYYTEFFIWSDESNTSIILRIDNVEIFGSRFANYLSQKGIVHQYTCSIMPPQNGVVECKTNNC